IYELYRRRPELLASLSLPAGYLVYYRRGAPHIVMDGADRVIWQEEEPLARWSGPGEEASPEVSASSERMAVDGRRVK
ncbi:MAG: hypothetical protein ACPHRO_15465, partial [Nannocystaceae bacterium]